MGPDALAAARPARGARPLSVLTRTQLRAAVCAAVPYDEPLAAGELACARGDKCEAMRLSGGRVVGRAMRAPQTRSHVQCPLCTVAAVQAVVESGRAVGALPFAVAAGAGPDEIDPRDCHPVARDGAAWVAGDMVTLAALGMRWTGAALAADGLGARDPLPNGPLCMCVSIQGGAARVHLPVTPDGRRRVSPLVARGADGWALRSIAGEAGVPHLAAGGDADAWEARVDAAWRAQPARRLWLGALLDAAAAGGGDWAGPWPGDLPDVLAVRDEVSVHSIYNDTYSAPRGALAAVAIVFKTTPRAAYRRECAHILARMTETCPGMAAILDEALEHVLLGTWPVPAARPTLAARRRALAFLADGRAGRAAWLEAHAPLVVVAAFYVRYVAERARGGAWAARPPAAQLFWARFEAVLEAARAAVPDMLALAPAPFAAPDAPGPGARVHAFAALVARWIALPRGGGGGATPRPPPCALASGAPPTDVRALVCMRCMRVVHDEVGGRGPCRLVKRHRDTGECCCASRAACTQRRGHGCCCATKSMALYCYDTATYRCTRRRAGQLCDAPLDDVPMDGAVLLLPRHGHAAYIACADCRKMCFYRRDHHFSGGYHCGCVVHVDDDPCFLCETRVPGGSWMLVARELALRRLCPDHERFADKIHFLRGAPTAADVAAQMWARHRLALVGAMGKTQKRARQ